MEEILSFEMALAQRFAQMRQRESLSLEDLAEGAQSLGLDWNRGKVFAIEKLAKGQSTAGTRRLSVTELLALPSIFERALRLRGVAKTFTLLDFLPREEEVTIGTHRVRREALELILRGGSFNFDGREDPGLRRAREIQTDRDQVLAMIASREVPEAAHTIPRLARRALEQTVATKLDARPELVAIASQQRWGHDLVTQRTEATPSEPPAGTTEEGAKKWRNVARGHATREILQDADFRALVASLKQRYAALLDPGADPQAPGGAFDPRRTLGRAAAEE